MEGGEDNIWAQEGGRNKDREISIIWSFVTISFTNYYPSCEIKVHKELMGEMRNAYRVSLEVCEWEKPFGRSRRRWEDKIKVNVKETDVKLWLRIGSSGGML